MDTIASINLINTIGLIHSLRERRRAKIYKNRFDPFTLPDEQFEKTYRFKKSTAEFIISLVQSDLQKDRRGCGVSPSLQVLTALRCWGRKEVQDNCGDIHGLSQPTVSRICCRVAKVIASHASEYIKMPEGLNEEQSTMLGFSSICGFPGVIGAIDCTHIKIKKTGRNSPEHSKNRKRYFSLNVQIICDANLQIMDLVARGSTYDSQIFSESNIKLRFEQGQFRGHLLGDSRYPLLPYLFTPIEHPNRQEEQYNIAHTNTHNTVQKCFGVWKQRFQCLLHGFTISLENTKTVIVALAVLHNISVIMEDNIAETDSIQQEIIPQVEVEYRSELYTNRPDDRALEIHSQFSLYNFITNNFKHD